MESGDRSRRSVESQTEIHTVSERTDLRSALVAELVRAEIALAYFQFNWNQFNWSLLKLDRRLLVYDRRLCSDWRHLFSERRMNFARGKPGNTQSYEITVRATRKPRGTVLQCGQTGARPGKSIVCIPKVVHNPFITARPENTEGSDE